MPRRLRNDRPPIASDDRTSCFFCTTRPAAWAHVVSGDLVDEHGDHYVIGNDLLTLCERCEDLFSTGAMGELMGLARRSRDDARSVAAWSLFAAAQPAYRFDHFVEDPEIAALLALGHVDLDGHTGVVDELAPLWPATDHLVVPDGRPNRWEDGERHLVHSPWPALWVPDVLNVLWRWVERDDDGLDHVIWTARVIEIFTWTEAEALALLRGPDPRRSLSTRNSNDI